MFTLHAVKRHEGRSRVVSHNGPANNSPAKQVDFTRRAEPDLPKNLFAFERLSVSGNRPMLSLDLRSVFTWWAGLFSVLLFLGCRAEVPARHETAQPTTTAAQSQEEAVIEPPFEQESDFRLLPRDQFDAFGAEEQTWIETREGFACSGKPKGYLYSKQSYQDFTLRLDYRFPRPETLKDESKFKGNTGFLIYVTGEHKLWPTCLEVQGKFLQMAAIKENGGAAPVKVDDNEQARQKARKPVGEWNSLEIQSQAGAVQVLLNGTLISKSEPDFLSAGLIGIQAEDHPFEVRRLRIRSELLPVAVP